MDVHGRRRRGIVPNGRRRMGKALKPFRDRCSERVPQLVRMPRGDSSGPTSGLDAAVVVVARHPLEHPVYHTPENVILTRSARKVGRQCHLRFRPEIEHRPLAQMERFVRGRWRNISPHVRPARHITNPHLGQMLRPQASGPLNLDHCPDDAALVGVGQFLQRGRDRFICDPRIARISPRKVPGTVPRAAQAIVTNTKQVYRKYSV